MKKRGDCQDVQKWFKESVRYENEPYTIDVEQAEAVACEAKNTIVVARAGSGKTRTIVAKISYLMARCGVEAREVMAFVFNANAAAEINARIGKMMVDGTMLGGEDGVEIASTFHAFARKVVYELCGGGQKCGKILAGEKEEFVYAIVQTMMKELKWRNKIEWFASGGVVGLDEIAEDINGTRRVMGEKMKVEKQEMWHFARMMALFINRAQQKFLAGENTLRRSADERLSDELINQREKVFIELGVECYRRYHWYLLDRRARERLEGGRFREYGTDFNLIVSWASKMIARGGENIREWLGGLKYVLVDEYQDFSQLFLSVVLAIRQINPGVKLFVVGDDWQAINRFAGSDVEYFKRFEKYFDEGVRRLTIGTNYRSGRKIVDGARGFMQKAMNERGEFRANQRKYGQVIIVEPRNTGYEHALVEYDRRINPKDYIYKQIVWRMMGREPKKKTVRYMKTVIMVIKQNLKMKEILLLHRNNETNLEGITLDGIARGLKWGFDKLGILSAEDFDEKIQIMTMHKSKGLEAEVVIILEADEGVIPKTHPDTRLYEIFGETEETSIDDQKRLFYVAMTRAKKKLYIIHDSATGGGFVRFLGNGVKRWGE